jgi:hypothetical protein
MLHTRKARAGPWFRYLVLSLSSSLIASNFVVIALAAVVLVRIAPDFTEAPRDSRISLNALFFRDRYLTEVHVKVIEEQIAFSAGG